MRFRSRWKYENGEHAFYEVRNVNKKLICSPNCIEFKMNGDCQHIRQVIRDQEYVKEEFEVEIDLAKIRKEAQAVHSAEAIKQQAKMALYKEDQFIRRNRIYVQKHWLISTRDGYLFRTTKTSASQKNCIGSNQ